MLTTLAALTLAFAQDDSREARYWRIETCKIPEGIELEVGGLLQLQDGRVLACTRRGEVWSIADAFGPEPKFVRFAQGLHEPLGLVERDGWIHVTQRGELSRMRDTDADGRADEFQTVCDAWPISGNYHEYNFGPALDRDGNFWITTNKPFGDEPYGRAKWRGFALKITPDARYSGKKIMRMTPRRRSRPWLSTAVSKPKAKPSSMIIRFTPIISSGMAGITWKPSHARNSSVTT